MTSISKLAVIAALAATAVASPALAQSFDPELGTGNSLPFSFAPTTSQKATMAAPRTHSKVAVQQSGANAFAMVPRGAFDPALTGGGSVGYNESLRNDAW